MLSLRAKLLLFLLPLIISLLVSALGVTVMIETQWQTLNHPGWLVCGFIVVFCAMITWVIWFVLHNVTSSLEYVSWAMNTASFDAKAEKKAPPKRFSDAFEIREILQATEQMKRDLVKSRVEVLENTKLAELGNAVAKVMHDMVTPMAVIGMTIATLKDHMEDKERMHMVLNGLTQAEKQVRGLYNDLLAQYRGEPTKVEAFSLPELLDSVMTSLKSTVLGKSAAWERCDATELLLAKGSYNLLHRAVSNIVKNGLEALYDFRPSEPKMTLTTSLVDEYHYEIQIHDNGPGIPEALQAAILKGGLTAGKKDGHGLGMQVARQAVEFHGGHLQVCSSKEKGTTFILRLPLKGVAVDETIECAGMAKPSKVIQLLDASNMSFEEASVDL